LFVFFVFLLLLTNTDYNVPIDSAYKSNRSIDVVRRTDAGNYRACMPSIIVLLSN